MAILTLVGGWLGYALGNRIWLTADREALASYSDQLLGHATAVIEETNKALDDTNAAPPPYCTPAEIEFLRNMLFGSRNLKDIGRVKDGALLCSTLLGVPSGHVPMPSVPYVELPDGTQIFPDTPLAVSNSTATIIGRGNADVVIDPRALDTWKDPPYHFAVYYGDVEKGQIVKMFGDMETSAPAPAEGVIWSHGAGVLRRDSCSTASGMCISVWASLSDLDASNHGFVDAVMLLGGALGALGALGWINFNRRDQSLMARLSRALNRQEVTLLYQPVVNVRDGKIVGAEALVRWQSNGDFVPPDVFTAIAEQKGMAGRISRYVFDRMIDEMAETLRLHEGFRITINIVAADLSDPKFFAALEDGLHHAGLTPHQIGIELTERSTADSTAAIEGIARLRARGHVVYIDDFGTGYSSLAYLGQLNVNVLKMDRAFTRTVGTDAVTVSIVPQIIDVAIKHNLDIVVEGIETEAQAEYFRNLPVPVMGQGWYYGKPVPAAKLIKLLEQQDGIVSSKRGPRKGLHHRHRSNTD
ncbi:EAL domain-containing protein [Phyllobacterium salinisoli]|nr:EAL domain-containing protein [Phyllobacterium salinisoli]